MTVNQSSSFCTISYVYNIWISRKFYDKSEVIVYFFIKLFFICISICFFISNDYCARCSIIAVDSSIDFWFDAYPIIFVNPICVERAAHF